MPVIDKTEGPLKRIRAARTLWENGDKEDAAALIFIAASGIARIRRPKDNCGDRKAFTSFIVDQIATITRGLASKPIRFPKTCKLPDVHVTENVPLEDIFYGCWRCVLIHEARWPDEVKLTPERPNSDYNQTIELHADGRLGLPESWIQGLSFAVEKAAEVVLPHILTYPCFVMFLGPVDARTNGEFCLRPGETKIARRKVRNQQCIQIFTDVEIMKTCLDESEIPGIVVREFSDSAKLREFILVGSSNDRFIFNPITGTKPLPSYSLDSVLAELTW